MQHYAHTAVLLFAESVDYQAQKKRLHPNEAKNFGLLHALTVKSKKTALLSGFDVFQFDERVQRGNTFGERLTDSMQQVFAKGYSRMIVIGGDCPDLGTKDLHRVQQQLDVHGMVMGPDRRGGVYVMGLKKSSFDASGFQSLDWQTPTLRRSLVEYAAHLETSIQWLHTKTDFNAAVDVNRYWKFSKAIRALVQQLAYRVILHWEPQHSVNLQFQVAEIDRRGP